MKLYLKIIIILFVLGAIIFFPMTSHTALTFTDTIQHPDETIAKYKNTWDDTTIKTGAGHQDNFSDGQKVATVTIPSLNMYELPVYYGSKGMNSEWQITTPGYAEGWGMFGDKIPAAIGSHNNQLFGTLPNINIGDRLIVETSEDSYVYEVTEKAVYDHTQNSYSDMVYKAQDYSLILMTCYPIDSIGSEDRYMVYTKLLKGTIH